jgi:hypothetical protein
MASSSSHNNNNDIPLTTVLEWYKIRDTLFGRNCVSQNISVAVELASSCDHPDARWLTEVCAGKDVNTKEDAKKVFSALGEDDARALCFAWVLGDRNDTAPLRRSAELGFAFAQALMVGETKRDEKLKFAQLAAAQGEREGFFWLGRCLCAGFRCLEDVNKAKENLLRASELGDAWAMEWLGELFDCAHPERWRWWGRAASLGINWRFLRDFPKQVESFDFGTKGGAVMFSIGRALHGHVNEEAKRIFNTELLFNVCVGPAKQAVAFYEQIHACRKAVDTWTMIGIRFKVVKDIRKVIATLVWNTRREAPIWRAGGIEQTK